jgi:hypothetical protein
MTFKNTKDFKDMVRAGSKEMRCAYGSTLAADTVANLFIVKDQGVYLMPAAEGKPAVNHVIYARGLDPSKSPFDEWYDKARDGLGGDDFSENIQLNQAKVDAILDGTITKMVLKFTPTTFEVKFFTKRAA